MVTSMVGREIESSTAGNHLLRGESSKSNGDCSMLPLQFFVRMITGEKNLVLHANLDDTVEMIHEKIEKMTGIPVMEQGLIYRGKQLQWEQTLEQCQIGNDAGLQLVGRMRSTDHPLAWRVITDMVSIICGICKNELPSFACMVVKVNLEQFLALPFDISNDNTSLVFKNDRKQGSKKKKKESINNDNDDDDKEEEDENENYGSINKTDYCKIFMDACAPQALVMLYVSSEKQNQECANDCIRCFVSFVKDLEGSRSERAYYATTVLEFCKLLRDTVDEDNLLYLHCRSTLGSMLEKAEVQSRPKEMHGTSKREMVGISIQDIFPLLEELGEKLMKDLMLSAESNASVGPLHQDVCDFSAFLQPMLSFIEWENSSPLYSHKGKQRASIAKEVDELYFLFTALLIWMDKCLNKMKLCLTMKRKKDVEVYRSGWSQYLAILKELSCISVLYLCTEDRFWTTMRQNKVAVRGLIVRYAKRTDDHSWLLKRKDVLDFESRRHFAMLMFPEAREYYEELLEILIIDRSRLLAESFEYISQAHRFSLHARLLIEFKNEAATGVGVLREWFCLVCQAIFDPDNDLFVACPHDSRRFFPSQASKVNPLYRQYFCFSGRVIAMALMHKIQVGVVLDRVFFLQLAGRHVSIEDIRDADPYIYNSCKQILEMDAEFVDSDGLGLTFATEVEEFGSRRVVELCSGGEGIVVNSKNRKEYVNLFVQHQFVTSITEQVSSFAKGFSDILRDPKVGRTFFEGLELEDLDWMLHGSGREISIKDWKAHTDYRGYKESDPQIIWFWEVVGQLNVEQKTTLLFFWTSVKYLPVKGFRGLESRVTIDKISVSDDRLPISHTCFYTLCFPPYPSKSVMQERLLVITQEHVGCSFGIW